MNAMNLINVLIYLISFSFLALVTLTVKLSHLLYQFVDLFLNLLWTEQYFCASNYHS